MIHIKHHYYIIITSLTTRDLYGTTWRRSRGMCWCFEVTGLEFKYVSFLHVQKRDEVEDSYILTWISDSWESCSRMFYNNQKYVFVKAPKDPTWHKGTKKVQVGVNDPWITFFDFELWCLPWNIQPTMWYPSSKSISSWYVDIITYYSRFHKKSRDNCWMISVFAILADSSWLSCFFLSVPWCLPAVSGRRNHQWGCKNGGYPLKSHGNSHWNHGIYMYLLVPRLGDPWLSAIYGPQK